MKGKIFSEVLQATILYLGEKEEICCMEMREMTASVVVRLISFLETMAMIFYLEVKAMII